MTVELCKYDNIVRQIRTKRIHITHTHTKLQLLVGVKGSARVFLHIEFGSEMCVRVEYTR